MTIEQKMAKADDYYKRGKYKQAIFYYTNIVYEKTSSLTPKAQMRLADSYFKLKQYDDARFQYEDLIKLFPDYQDVATAYYMIGVCYYKQSLPPEYTQDETLKAIDAFSDFIDKFPLDERKNKALEYINKCNYKLLQKKYLNGYTYYKIYDYSAALMYFDEIIKLGNKNEPDRKSLYYSSIIYLKQKRYDKAKDTASKLIKKYPASKEAKKIKKYLKKYNIKL
jgi:outer membrane protein assembly factor BamD